tara:strand:+ start:129 stop:542 length:414 start_codon:yes stop_codon:yes gene_type:complete
MKDFYSQLCRFQASSFFQQEVNSVIYSPENFSCSKDPNYATFQIIYDDHVLSHGGVSNVGECNIQYSIYSTKVADVLSQVEELIGFYEGNTYDIGGGFTINYAKLRNLLSTDDNETTITDYGRVVEFTFRYTYSEYH